MTAERYTVVFTGLLRGRRPGEYPYLTMSELGHHTLRRGRPSGERRGREVRFRELPEACRNRVIEIYRSLWGL